MKTLLAAMLLAVTPQDPARELVEQLRSDDLETREGAARKLKELGKAARPALEEAAKSADGALAIRIRQLLERQRLVELLTPALQEAIPSVADRLAWGTERTWVEVFIEAEALGLKAEGGRRSLPKLRKRDLEALAPGAVRGARDQEHRREVIEALRRRAIRSANDELLAYFDDPDHDVRQRANAALSRVAPPRRLRARVVELLSHERTEVRVFALERIANWELADTRALVEKALKDPESPVRAQAVSTLEDIAGTQSFEAFKPMLEDSSGDVRKAAVRAVARSRAPGAFKAISPRLQDEDVEVVEAALQVSGRIGDPAAIPRFVSFLGSENQFFRIYALMGLRDLEAGGEIEKILPLLTDEDDYVRTNALRFLERHHPAVAVREAVASLKDSKDPDYALRVIGEKGTAKDAPAVLGAMASREKDREEFARALGDLGSAEAVPALTALVDKGSPKEIREALLALGRLKAKIAPEVLESRLAHSASEVRCGAAQVLRMLDPPPSGKLFIPLLEDAYPEVRYHAVRGVTRVLGPEATPLLVARLKDTSGWVCIEAIFALAALNAWTCSPQVAPLVDDSDSDVRSAAAAFLIASGGSVDLDSLLEESDPRFFFLNALRRPDVWKRLNAARFIPVEGDTVQQSLRKTLEASEMKLEVRVAQGSSSLFDDKDYRFLSWRGHDLEAAPSLAVGLARDWVFPLVFDEDSVQVMTYPEARAFWSAWWKEQKSSKKK